MKNIAQNDSWQRSNTFTEELQFGIFHTFPSRPHLQKIKEVKQVHGTKLIFSKDIEEIFPEGDGIISKWEDLDHPIGIKTADCLPIVIEGREGVCFIHAGWRGLHEGILNAPLIQSILPEFAFIGPSIQQCCFEVSEDFKTNFPSSPFFIRRKDKWYFDLQKESQHQLKRNFPEIKINDCGICTCCHEHLNSYRQNKTIQRNWNIYLKKNLSLKQFIIKTI